MPSARFFATAASARSFRSRARRSGASARKVKSAAAARQSPGCEATAGRPSEAGAPFVPSAARRRMPMSATLDSWAAWSTSRASGAKRLSAPFVFGPSMASRPALSQRQKETHSTPAKPTASRIEAPARRAETMRSWTFGV